MCYHFYLKILQSEAQDRTARNVKFTVRMNVQIIALHFLIIILDTDTVRNRDYTLVWLSGYSVGLLTSTLGGPRFKSLTPGEDNGRESIALKTNEKKSIIVQPEVGIF